MLEEARYGACKLANWLSNKLCVLHSNAQWFSVIASCVCVDVQWHSLAEKPDCIDACRASRDFDFDVQNLTSCELVAGWGAKCIAAQCVSRDLQ